MCARSAEADALIAEESGARQRLSELAVPERLMKVAGESRQLDEADALIRSLLESRERRRSHLEHSRCASRRSCSSHLQLTVAVGILRRVCSCKIFPPSLLALLGDELIGRIRGAERLPPRSMLPAG